MQQPLYIYYTIVLVVVLLLMMSLTHGQSGRATLRFKDSQCLNTTAPYSLAFTSGNCISTGTCIQKAETTFTKNICVSSILQMNQFVILKSIVLIRMRNTTCSGDVINGSWSSGTNHACYNLGDSEGTTVKHECMNDGSVKVSHCSDDSCNSCSEPEYASSYCLPVNDQSYLLRCTTAMAASDSSQVSSSQTLIVLSLVLLLLLM
jgi:hypothetical protein